MKLESKNKLIDMFDFDTEYWNTLWKRVKFFRFELYMLVLSIIAALTGNPIMSSILFVGGLVSLRVSSYFQSVIHVLNTLSDNFNIEIKNLNE